MFDINKMRAVKSKDAFLIYRSSTLIID